jgi:hypothetical protein
MRGLDKVENYMPGHGTMNAILVAEGTANGVDRAGGRLELGHRFNSNWAAYAYGDAVYVRERGVGWGAGVGVRGAW